MALGPSLTFWGDGMGGNAGCRISTVYTHQLIRITTITVVICMMRMAFWLDSCTPLMLYHQKKSVHMTAKHAAPIPGAMCSPRWMYSEVSLMRPTMYCPADTPLMGPVRM